MKVNKILLNVSNLGDIEKYKKLGISNFLFPLEGYSVGYESFSFKDIEETGVKTYILVNRLLTDNDIDEFLKLDIPSNVEGFIIEDVGLYYALRDSKYELISFQNHLNNNYKTVNFWLSRFDSIVLSTDITLEEISKIIEEAKKPVIFFTYGHPMVMYSRRTLVSNYHEYLKEKSSTDMEVDIPSNDNSFILKENEFGTGVFSKNVLDARSEASSLDDEKVKFYLVDTNFFSFDEVKDVIEGKEQENTKKGFLYTKTVYRIGDLK